MKLSDEALMLLNQFRGSKDEIINQLKSLEIEDMPDLMHADMENIIQECTSYLEQSDDDIDSTFPESSII